MGKNINIFVEQFSIAYKIEGESSRLLANKKQSTGCVKMLNIYEPRHVISNNVAF